MKKNIGILVAFAIMMLALGSASSVYAYGGPLEQGHAIGPAIIGTFTFKPGGLDGSGNHILKWDFVGHCGSTPIDAQNQHYPDPNDPYSSNPWEDVLYGGKAALESYLFIFYQWLPIGCLPNLHGSDPQGVVIIKVTSYDDSQACYLTDPKIIADVVMLWATN